MRAEIAWTIIMHSIDQVVKKSERKNCSQYKLDNVTQNLQVITGI